MKGELAALRRAVARLTAMVEWLLGYSRMKPGMSVTATEIIEYDQKMDEIREALSAAKAGDVVRLANPGPAAGMRD